MVTCYVVLSRIEAYLDGELPLGFLLDADCHLTQCRSCRMRVEFERALHAHIRNAMKVPGVPSRVFDRRIREALIANHASSASTYYGTTRGGYSATTPDRRVPACASPPSRSTSRRSNLMSSSVRWPVLNWRLTLPGATVLVAVCWRATMVSGESLPMSPSSDLRLSQLDDFLDAIVKRHLDKTSQGQPNRPVRVVLNTSLTPPFPLPPMQNVRGLRAPPGSSESRAWSTAFVGESASYSIEGHYVTFFAYRAHTVPLRARLGAQLVSGQVVYTGIRRGYSIAAVESGPIGYAMTSDFTPAQNARIILSAVTSSQQN